MVEVGRITEGEAGGTNDENVRRNDLLSRLFSGVPDESIAAPHFVCALLPPKPLLR